MDAVQILAFATSILEVAKLAVSNDGFSAAQMVERAAKMVEDAILRDAMSQAKREESAVKKVMWTVNLKSYGALKIQAIKILREISYLGLKEAKELVESAPCVLLETDDPVKAVELYNRLASCYSSTGEDMSVKLLHNSDEYKAHKSPYQSPLPPVS